jgi:hypothetical protein
MTAATFFTALAGVIAVIGLAIFIFGIPPEIKRKMERTALKTMGENKLSYVAKGASHKASGLSISVSNALQAKLTRSPPPTRPTLSSSRRASATSLAAQARTHSAKQQARLQTA